MCQCIPSYFTFSSSVLIFFQVALHLPVDVHEKLQLSLSNVVKVRVFITNFVSPTSPRLDEAKMARVDVQQP